MEIKAIQQLHSTKRVFDFLERFEELRLYSTGFEVVDYSGDLYNVRGSSGDPRPGSSDSWKDLLGDEAGLADAECYVTNVPAPGTSTHPQFRVGGHMTPNSDGNVPVGDDCYLMPLCSWHNHPSRVDRFEHEETRTLKLIGYMQEEPFATFAIRLPSTSPFALLYFDEADAQWKHRNISKAQSLDLDLRVFGRKKKAIQCKNRVLFERASESQLLQSIKATILPAAA